MKLRPSHLAAARLVVAPVMLPLLLLALAPNIAAADCITASIDCSGYVNHHIDTTGPQASADCSQDELTSHVSFDEIHGTASVLATTSGRHFRTETAVSNMDDAFVVTGLPPGTPVTITALADLVLGNVRTDLAAKPVNAILWLTRLSSPSSQIYDAFDYVAPSSGTFSTTHQLRVDWPATAGVPFEVQLLLGAQSETGAGGSVDARLHFEGLAPGVSITSCKGYSQEGVVPALARSWGSVKATYR